MAPVDGLYQLEQKLNQINDANVLHLRAGYFMENTLPQIGAIRMLNITAGPVRADLKLPFISTVDIGTAAANALIAKNFKGKQTQELQGQRDLDYAEAATIIGNAIGKPGLGYIQAPDNQIKAAMVQMGMSESYVNLILGMARALNEGRMRTLEPRTAANTTPTKFETFVAESFAPAYNNNPPPSKYVWSGHSCPLPLTLGVVSGFDVWTSGSPFVDAISPINRLVTRSIKTNVKGSGQECPLHTKLKLETGNWPDRLSIRHRQPPSFWVSIKVCPESPTPTRQVYLIVVACHISKKPTG